MSEDAVKYKSKQPTEKERIVRDLHRMTTTFYTEEEVKKLIDAYSSKYNISKCDGLPYYPQAITVLTGIQIVDLEKLK